MFLTSEFVRSCRIKYSLPQDPVVLKFVCGEQRKVQQPGDELVGSLSVSRFLLLVRRRKDLLSDAELLLS